MWKNAVQPLWKASAKTDVYSEERILLAMLRDITLLFLIILGLALLSFKKDQPKDPISGAWKLEDPALDQIITFTDQYCVVTAYHKEQKTFLYTWGGPYIITGNKISITLQFHTANPQAVGTRTECTFTTKRNFLETEWTSSSQTWKKLDPGEGPLAGVWRISGRKQGETISNLPLGVRRTLKTLTGTRFQWTAINIETKEFFGTGGGTYSFENGVYTENIEFFSRDSSRVGATLQFEGKIVEGKWHHSGKSSKGEPIYEIWEKLASN